MFLVPEGMKGLGLVSMATGRRRWVINPSPPSCGEGGGLRARKLGSLFEGAPEPLLCGVLGAQKDLADVLKPGFFFFNHL
jgi:hypothetical protein